MQHFFSQPQLLTVSFFPQNSSIIDVRLSSKYAPDYLTFSSYSTVNAFVRNALVRFFSQRNPYTAKTTHLKAENDMMGCEAGQCNKTSTP